MARSISTAAKKWQFGVFVALIGLICAPIFAGLAGVPDASGVQEMRALAPFPIWNRKTWTQWMPGFEAWLNDHYPLRRYLIQWHSTVWHRWFRAPAPRVVVGRDHWLFYSGDKTTEDWLGHDRFDPSELVRWKESVEGRRAWLRQRGIQYLLVLVPNKSTIYPERLPLLLRSQHQSGKFDQLVNYLRSEHSPVAVLDLRPVLRANKALGINYWPTDSHWNASGLAAACAAIEARLPELGLPPPNPVPTGSFAIEHPVREGDCVSLLGMNGHWPPFVLPQLRVEHPADFRSATTPLSKLAVFQRSGVAPALAFEHASGAGRAVMLSDSFFRVGGLPADAEAQTPLILRFRRLVSIWDWQGSENLSSPEMVRAIANQEHPDIVIEEWTERYLRSSMPTCPEFAQARLAN